MSTDGINLPLTRREVLRDALAGGMLLSTSGVLAACGGGDGGGGGTGGTPARSAGKLRVGGVLRVGATGGGAKDSIDAHRPTVDTDIMRCWNLYESLAVRSPDFSKLEMLLAESIAGQDAEGVGHPAQGRFDVPQRQAGHGRRRDLLAQADPGSEGSEGRGGVDRLRRAGAAQEARRPHRSCDAEVPQRGLPGRHRQVLNAIVPADYDPKNPVDTGPFKYVSFTAGEQSEFAKFADYWQPGRPYVGKLVIIDFPDDTARVNALLGGQVDVIDNLPAAQLQSVKSNPNLRVVSSETGAWQPFTMRVDQAPFNDVKVRQAFRLIVDREQMVQQALSGQGRVANDLYCPTMRTSPATCRSASRTSSRPSPCSSRPGARAFASSSSPHRCSKGSSRRRRCSHSRPRAPA